jgi:hypothetical protein
MTPEKHPAQADYSKLTDGELNRLVAERQGWTIERGSGLQYMGTGEKTVWQWRYYNPTVGRTDIVILYEDTDVWAWLFDNVILSKPASDLNAAAGLDFDTCTLVIKVYPQQYISATIEVLGRDGVLLIYEAAQGAVTLARAWVIAWLRYMDATQEAGT